MPRSLLLLFLLAPSLLAAEGKPRPRLVEGKFGKALDVRSTPLAFTGDRRYRTPPLTVECWTRLNNKNDFNVLVANDSKSSSRHWEIYSYARSGTFSAYLPGFEPSEIRSKKDICDRKWHHVAMTFDGKRARLFVDGSRVADQAIKPRPGGKPIPGPLTIGMALDGDQRIGCDGLIDEVHLSRVLRTINQLPTAAPKLDADTIGLWRFDESDSILADPAWTPPPVLSGEPWERYTDVDWIDPRLRLMDTGLTFNATMRYPRLGGSPVMVYKATAIRIGEAGEAAVIFDRGRLRLAAGWTGAYLNQSDRRFGLLNTPSPAGSMVFTTNSGPGWADPSGKWDCPSSKYAPTLPLPTSWGRYQGMYLHGKRVVLAYQVGATEVRESPWLESITGVKVITRTIEVGPCRHEMRLRAGDFTGATVNGRSATFDLANKQRGLIYLAGEGKLGKMAGDRAGLEVVLPASDSTRQVRLYYALASPKEIAALLASLPTQPAALTLMPLTRPGPPRWTREIVTRGEVAKDTAAHVVDTLTIPYDNPYKALFFCTGVDVLPDGRIAVCTCHGDVWLVSGVDASLAKLTWKRFATGLYQPLGLKVVDGKVIVLERGQLTRLHEGPGGEAHFYENLCSDWHTGSGEHSYDTCLECDSAGNFYFFKTGDTDLPHGGCLMRVSPDGKKVSVFATGFRHPIGLSVGPGDIVTGADQEGNWMPATRIDVYKTGGFYGDMRAHHRAKAPTIYDPPLLWLPRQVDNSAGGQAWVANDRFGLPRGQLLHLSFGRCKLFSILMQKVGDVRQAGAVDLGVTFLSGSMRARFHPRDGHLYVCGLNGWQTGARRDGCLQRVRFTGQVVLVPTALSVHADGIRLTFPEKLDAKYGLDPRRFEIEVWNYRWSGDYGSKRWSVAHPKREGQDSLSIDRITLGADGKSVFLYVQGLKPVMQMRIGYELRSADGKKMRGEVHNTIHRLAEGEKAR